MKRERSNRYVDKRAIGQIAGGMNGWRNGLRDRRRDE
jgi:hypothetical protein